MDKKRASESEEVRRVVGSQRRARHEPEAEAIGETLFWLPPEPWPPAVLWQRYVILVQIEEAFKSRKSELRLGRIYRHVQNRQTHILVAFLANCLLVTLKNRLQALARGLTPFSRSWPTMQTLVPQFPHLSWRWCLRRWWLWIYC